MITGALFWSIWLGLQSQWPMQRLEGLLASRKNKVNRLRTKVEECWDVGDVLERKPKELEDARKVRSQKWVQKLQDHIDQNPTWSTRSLAAEMNFCKDTVTDATRRTLNKDLTGAKQVNLVFIGHSIICTSKFSIKVHFFGSVHSTKNCFPPKLSVLEGWNQLWSYIMNS